MLSIPCQQEKGCSSDGTKRLPLFLWSQRYLRKSYQKETPKRKFRRLRASRRAPLPPPRKLLKKLNQNFSSFCRRPNLCRSRRLFSSSLECQNPTRHRMRKRIDLTHSVWQGENGNSALLWWEWTHMLNYYTTHFLECQVLFRFFPNFFRMPPQWHFHQHIIM